MINSHALINRTYDPIGVVLSPLSAKLNHSCHPNCYVRCNEGGDGTLLDVIALHDIKKDDELFISYIDTSYPRRVRQEELRDRYFFECRCPKCTTDESLDFDRQNLTEDEIQEKQSVEKHTLDLIGATRRDYSVLEYVNELRAAMSRLHRIYWPIAQQPFPELRHQYMLTLIAEKDYVAALTQAIIQRLFLDPIVLPEDNHPLRLVHDWLLIKLLATMAEVAEVANRTPDREDYEIRTDISRAIIVDEANNVFGTAAYKLNRGYIEEMTMKEWNRLQPFTQTLSAEIIRQEKEKWTRLAEKELDRERT